MKTKLPGIVLLLALCVAGLACVSVPYQPVQHRPVVVAAPPPGPEDQPFYEDLAPYGEWVHVSGPGWVWSPYGIDAGWRPYRLGHWVLTDYGWTWVSDEDFGWVAYHYGRWHDDPHYGWVWVPGTEWGPAWVAWHEGGGWVGWAPLPWQVRWHAGVGLDWGGVSMNVAIGPSAWGFVPARAMIDPGVRHRIAPPARNVTLIQITHNVTNYVVVNNRIVNRSVDEEKIGRAVGHTIPRYRVRQADPAGTPHGGRVRGNELEVFRPGAAVRGAKSQGRAVAPGHDETRMPDRGRLDRPSRGRPHENPPDTATPENTPAADSDRREPPQQAGQDEERPSRLSRPRGPKRPVSQPPGSAAAATTEPAPVPDQGTAADSPSETRSRGQEPETRRDAPASTPRSEPATARPVEPGQPGSQSISPAGADAKSEKPAQGKGKPGKSKSRKSGEAIRKNGKAASPESVPEGSEKDKPKPEESGSERKD